MDSNWDWARLYEQRKNFGGRSNTSFRFSLNKPLGAMQLFRFTVEVKDGEHEYSHFHLLRARTEASANKRAQKYAQTFLGSRTRPYEWARDIRGRKLHPIRWEPTDGVEYRLVEMKGVTETTEQELLHWILT